MLIPLIKKGLFYCFSIGTEALISLALLPLLSRFITPEEYGTWVLYVALFSFMRPILGLMLHDVIKMRFFELTEYQLRHQLRCAILTSLFVFFCSLCLTWIFSNQITIWFAFPGEYFWLVLMTAFLHSLMYSVLAVMQFKERHDLFLYTQAVQAVCAIAMSYVLLFAGYSWIGAAFGRNFALLIVDVLGLCWVSSVIGNPFSVELRWSTIKSVAATGLKFLPVGLTPVIIPLANRVALTQYWGKEQTAYYGIASLISMGICIFYTGLLSAFQPMLFRSQQVAEAESERAHAAKFTLTYMALVALSAAGITLFGIYFGKYLMAYDMERVKPYLIWLAIAVALEGFHFYNISWLHSRKMVRTISILSIGAICVNCALLYLLVPSQGGIGAAQATGLSYAAAFLISSLIIWSGRGHILPESRENSAAISSA